MQLRAARLYLCEPYLFASLRHTTNARSEADGGTARDAAAIFLRETHAVTDSYALLVVWQCATAPC